MLKEKYIYCWDCSEEYISTLEETIDLNNFTQIMVVEESFFNKNKCLDDSPRQELKDLLYSSGFAEYIEACFEYMGSKEEVSKILDKIGMKYSKELQKRMN